MQGFRLFSAFGLFSLAAVLYSAPQQRPAMVRHVPPEFVFTAAGDFGLSQEAAATLEAMAQSGARVHLALGDLSYGGPDSEMTWCNFVRARVGKTPFQIVAGNHEADWEHDGRIATFSACLPDRMNSVGDYGREYYFDVPGLARFILLSPDLTIEGKHYFYGGSNDRYAWAVHAIRDARSAGIPWVIVGMHKSCLSMAQYYCHIHQELFSLLIEEKVDLVLQGHDHSYQRTKQISSGPSCGVVKVDTFNPSCLVTTARDDLYEKGAGPVFVLTAAAGGKLYDVNEGDAEAGYFAAWMGANRKPRNGFSRFRLTPDELSAEFVGSTATSDFSDHFKIQRRSPGPPPRGALDGGTMLFNRR